MVLGYNIYCKKVANLEASQNNKSYESFYDQPVLGTDVISVINKAIDSNTNKEDRSVISKWYNKTKEMMTYIICCKCRRRKTAIKEKTE